MGLRENIEAKIGRSIDEVLDGAESFVFERVTPMKEGPFFGLSSDELTCVETIIRERCEQREKAIREEEKFKQSDDSDEKNIRERVERKIGCSLEKYHIKKLEEMMLYFDMIVDGPPDSVLYGLTSDENDFLWDRREMLWIKSYRRTTAKRKEHTMPLESELISAHKCCRNHMERLKKDNVCGCFYCLKIFSPKEIKMWLQDAHGDPLGTAICPYCGIDSVIGESSGFPITHEFLRRMERYWFNCLPEDVTGCE